MIIHLLGVGKGRTRPISHGILGRSGGGGGGGFNALFYTFLLYTFAFFYGVVKIIVVHFQRQNRGKTYPW